jgi:hypothetical protein
MNRIIDRRLQYRHFDKNTYGRWLVDEAMFKPEYFSIRSPDAFSISILNNYPWSPDRLYVDVMAFCTDDGGMWQLVKLFRASIEWGRRYGAAQWHILADDFDIGPIARRLGAKQTSIIRYDLDLGS